MNVGADAGVAVFLRTFRPQARRVRGRLALAAALGGASVGLSLGVGLAAAAWWLRLDAARPFGAALGLIGALAAVALSRRRRWGDSQVALFLDRKLDSAEAITTAVEIVPRADATDREPARAAHARILRHATVALTAAGGAALGPRVARAWHLSAPVALGAVVALSLIALPPPPPAPAPPPGSDVVTLDELPELDDAVALGSLESDDPEERERLRDIAARAEALRERLRAGMERRAAQAELAKLREDVAAERQRMGSGRERRGLEAALAKLGASAELADAQRALGDRDLTRFDREMERLATLLEERDRKTAEKSLEEAAKAAREQGAEKVARSLEEQKRLLGERAKRSAKMRELARAFGEGLGDEARRRLEALERSGSAEDAQRLADALGEALEGLNDEEQKRLAERLRAMAEQDRGEGDSPGAEALEELERELATPEGRRALAERLRRMAQDPMTSRDAERDGRLGDAERGLGEAERRLGGAVPAPGGGGKPGPGGNGEQRGGGATDRGRGGGPGKHGGQTPALSGSALRARADAPLNPAAGNPGSSPGRAPGRAGETANRRGTGALGSAAPDEVSGVDRSDVPREYRDQVGRYFEP
jgi:hypothetical protein